jgi:hypothetical protein
MRGDPYLSLRSCRLPVQVWRFRGRDNPHYGISIPQNFKKLWQLLEFASLIPIPSARFLLPSILGYIVIAERYTPDFIVWVSTTTKDPDYPRSFQARFLMSLALKAEVRIYVTAGLGALLERRGNVDPSFLRDRIGLYEEIAKSSSTPLIGALKSPSASRRTS